MLPRFQKKWDPDAQVSPRHPDGDREFMEDITDEGWKFVDDPFGSLDFIILSSR
ncbi:hypothetical protein BG003_000681, partial [Podila horticola]